MWSNQKSSAGKNNAGIETETGYRGVSFVKKKIILYLAAAFLIFGCIFVFYKINSLIPDGIFVSGVAEAEIQAAYKDLCAQIDVYDVGEIPEKATADTPPALLVTPHKGAEQILAFTLKERCGENNVRDLATERRIRLAALEALACFALFIFFNAGIFALIGEKGKNYRYLLRIGEFFMLCFLVSRRGVLPSVCIPEKFIYLSEWWGKCESYFRALHEAGQIPCVSYQKYAPFQAGLLVLFCVGAVVLGFARHPGRGNRF